MSPGEAESQVLLETVDAPVFPLFQRFLEEVAAFVNDDKRHAEELTMLQESIAGWEGPDLVETSSMLIHEGDLWKISGGNCQLRRFFLLDNLESYKTNNALLRDNVALLREFFARHADLFSWCEPIAGTTLQLVAEFAEPSVTIDGRLQVFND